MPTTLNSSDRRVILTAVVVAGISLALGVKYFSRVFPEASIEFRVNRDDSTPIAIDYLAHRAVSLNGYQHAAVFDFDDDAKVYLERTQGLARMNKLARGPVHLWRWSHRWFKPQQKEEFRVDVSPMGEVVGFSHELPESAAGANLDSAAARAIAKTFLEGAMNRDLPGLEFVESSSEKRPARTDYSFTWKQKNVSLGDGSLRVEVEVDGDKVCEYREYVKIPDEWSRDYKKLRARNEAANMVDEVPWILLSIGGLILLIRRVRQRDVPVRLSLAFGLTASLLYFLGQLNEFSQAQFGYSTTDSYSSFASGYVVESLLSALGIGAFIFLLLASTEPLYRESYPQFISLRRYFSWRGLRSRQFFIANVVGISMTFFFFAYQSIFYLVANKLGAWAPADVPFSDLLNTRFPWVMVLFIGFFPAVSEEIQFRAFAIPFLRKYLKMGPFAVVLAAFMWGFLHSAYPNQPFFIRGLEVGFGGIIVGFIMLRFGIMATMIWHYSVDALYTAFLLLRSPNHYLMISGGIAAGIMLVPLAASLVAYVKTGTFSDEENLLNANEKKAEPLPEPAAAPHEATIAYQPLSSSRLLLAGIFTAIFIAIALIHTYRLGEGISLHQSPKEAVQIAENYLKQQKIDPAPYRHVAWIQDNLDTSAMHYLAERKSLQQADNIYRQATKPALWAVRFYRPLQKEEYTVYVDPVSSQVFTMVHTLDEDAPGPSLTPGQARAIADQAVRDHGYSLDGFELQSSDANKRKAREDYTIVYQAKSGDPRNVGDAHYRLQVEIAGDQVTGFTRSFKLPEDWERAQEGRTLANNALLGVLILTLMALVGAFLVVFINLVRAGTMQWKESSKFAALLAVIVFFATLNGIGLTFQKYDTALPLDQWNLRIAIGVVVVPLLEGLLAWLLVGSAISVYPNIQKLFATSARRVWRRDALVALVVSLAAGAALMKADSLLANLFHAYTQFGDELVPASLATTLPAAGMFLSVVNRTLLLGSAAAVAISIVVAGWQKKAWWLWVIVALLLASLGPMDAHSAAEFGAGWIEKFLPLAVAIAIVVLFLRDNILAYVVVLIGVEAAEGLLELFSQHAKFYWQNGVALGLLAAIALLWLLLPAGARSKA
jgi:membrane protease YdiL (CAAX protease family)